MAESMSAYRAERYAINATIQSLTDVELASAPTLCDGWAPRDVMGHLLGVDAALLTYLRYGGQTAKANAFLVAKYKRLSLEQLRLAVQHWADKPALTSLAAGAFLLGDVGIHHQDIVRGLGRAREIAPATSAAILREGLILGGALKLRSFRIQPTDGGRSMGRGTRVSGTREALGMWLSGRGSVADDLTFGA